MKMRWAAALLLLTGLGVSQAWADGFGFTVANATVTNAKAAGNTDVTKAEVGDTFTITGASFSSYRSSGSAPAINDNDLNRYSANLNGAATEVTGSQVRYKGTFSITYTGSVVETIVTGKLDVRAVYSTNGIAIVRGFLTADPKLTLPAPWDKTDFSLYNPGRFYGVYQPTPGDSAHGTLSCSLNAGNVGFAASVSDSTVQNIKGAGNNDTAHAQVGDTFAMAAPLASYYTIGGPPLTDNDLSRYTLVFNGTVTDVTGTVVTYVGTFALKYTSPLYPSGLSIETGGLQLVASYDDTFTGAAKLSAQLVARPGYETTEAAWANTDFAIFNPAVFSGTYKPTTPGATTGIVSGSLQGGVLGFSASIADGVVVNHKATGNTDVTKAEVGDPFNASGPLSAYLAVGAPPLTDRDLNRYTVILDGTATSVVGTTVVYDGSFRITYAGPGISASIESGAFEVIAVYDALGNARLSGTLTANPGADTAVPPFNTTDYAGFNPARFTGSYTKVAVDHGSLRGGLIGGALAVPIQSRLVGTAIEGSATAATQTDDARRAIVASGNKLFVLDPATGDDAPGWAGGKAINGKVYGRAAVLKDSLYVGTDTGYVYAYDLKTGTLLNSVQLDANAHIYAGLAVVDKTLSGDPTDTIVVPVFRTDLNQTLLYKVPTTLTAPLTVKLSNGAISTSTASVPQNGLIFVGTNAGMFTVRYSDLSIQNTVNTLTPTSPLSVAGSIYVATGTGTTFRKLNGATGGTDAQFELSSQLMISAFYEKRSNLIQAGTADGRISSFDTTGAFVGYTLPGLFNPDYTGGSQSMPVSSNNVLYRATENKEILSGTPLNGDDQQMIAVTTPVRGAMAATGQTPGADFLIATSSDGLVHLIGIR